MHRQSSNLPDLRVLLAFACFGAFACGGAVAPVATGGEDPVQETTSDTESIATQSDDVPAHCVSQTGCPNAAPIPACQDVVETLSVNEVLNQWEALDGQTVHVLGPLMTHTAMCTLMECGEENPCCNACGGPLTFDPDTTLGDDPRFSCNGDSSRLCCGYAFSPAENVRTSGRIGVDRIGGRQLFDAVVCIPAD